jgi:DedD protein
MAKQLTADEASNLKKQARRRLIGAVALTTAVVVILPMVFDSEPTTTVNDIELAIPNKDTVTEFVSASAVSAASEVMAVSAIAPAFAASAVAPVVVPPLPTPVAEVKKQPEAEVAKPAKVEVKQEAKPKTENKPKVEAVAKVESKPTADTHTPAKSGFAIQVGAFSNAASAQAMQDKLNKQGLHAYTEKVGNNVRVRVGGFPSREAAEKVRHKLEAQGLHPNVVSLGG